MRCSIGAVVLVLLVAVLVRAQDETYSLKLKLHPRKGQSVKVVEKERQVGKFKISDKDDKVRKEGEIVYTEETVYTEKITEVGAKGPTRMQRIYDKAVFAFDDRKGVLQQQGRTIVFEYSDGKVTATADGKPELPKMVLEGLAQKAKEAFSNTRAALLPKKAVKVGENWSPSGKELNAMFAGQPNADKIKAKGKLVKAYRKGGKQWGQLEFTFPLPSSGPGKDKTILGEGSWVIDFPIDGSSTDAIVKMQLKLAPGTTTKGKGDKKVTTVQSSVITITTQRTETK